MQAEALGALLGVPNLPEHLDAVDERVREVLRSDDRHLGSAVLRVGVGGGKRLRPVLTIAFAELGGSYNPHAAIAGAAAVELVQIGSLVHDDLLDRATTRRGVPTINAAEGDSLALVAGDFILAKAAEQALLVNPEFAALLGRTMTWLCEGELLELRDQFNVERSIESYMKSIRSKTAVLFAAACAAGAHCARMSEHELARAVGFGTAFGVAYQLFDDVLDFVADADRLGKPTGIDLDSGVYTLPVLLQMAKGDDSIGRLLQEPTGTRVAAVRELVTKAGTIDETLATSERYADDASAQMTGRTGAVAQGLVAFPRTYFRWAIEHFVPPRQE